MVVGRRPVPALRGVNQRKQQAAGRLLRFDPLPASVYSHTTAPLSCRRAGGQVGGCRARWPGP
jgi:hypothetical protein